MYSRAREALSSHFASLCHSCPFPVLPSHVVDIGCQLGIKGADEKSQCFVKCCIIKISTIVLIILSRSVWTAKIEVEAYLKKRMLLSIWSIVLGIFFTWNFVCEKCSYQYRRQCSKHLICSGEVWKENHSRVTITMVKFYLGYWFSPLSTSLLLCFHMYKKGNF